MTPRPRAGLPADLLGSIYAASLDSGLWQAVVEGLAASFETHIAALHRYDFQAGQGLAAVSVGLPDGGRSYAERYSRINPWLRSPGAGAVPAGEVLVGSRLISDRQLERGEFHDDFLRPIDGFYSMGVTLSRVATRRASATVVRGRRHGDFSAEEQARLAALGVHLRRALEIEERLASVAAERRALANALDRLAVGVVLVSPSGRVLVANRRARQLSAARDGFALGADCVLGATPALTARVGALLQGAARTGTGLGASAGGWMALPRPSGRRAYALLVAPLAAVGPQERQLDGTAAIVFVSDPERGPGGIAPALRSVFELTPAEADLAAGLLAGRTLREQAGLRGVGLATVRSQMKCLLAKTQTSRQAELVAVLARSLRAAPDDDGDGLV